MPPQNKCTAGLIGKNAAVTRRSLRWLEVREVWRFPELRFGDDAEGRKRDAYAFLSFLPASPRPNSIHLSNLHDRLTTAYQRPTTHKGRHGNSKERVNPCILDLGPTWSKSGHLTTFGGFETMTQMMQVFRISFPSQGSRICKWLPEREGQRVERDNLIGLKIMKENVNEGRGLPWRIYPVL